MPKLSCWSCGRQIYTVAPLEALFAEERRCPRCGAFLHQDRREAERRLMHRRTNPTHDPGPPRPAVKPGVKATRKPTTATSGKSVTAPAKARSVTEATDDAERRVADRRTVRRRGGTTLAPPVNVDDPRGWQD
jgi:hypothetical protein